MAQLAYGKFTVVLAPRATKIARVRILRVPHALRLVGAKQRRICPGPPFPFLGAAVLSREEQPESPLCVRAAADGWQSSQRASRIHTIVHRSIPIYAFWPASLAIEIRTVVPESSQLPRAGVPLYKTDRQSYTVSHFLGRQTICPANSMDFKPSRIGTTFSSPIHCTPVVTPMPITDGNESERNRSCVPCHSTCFLKIGAAATANCEVTRL